MNKNKIEKIANTFAEHFSKEKPIPESRIKEALKKEKALTAFWKADLMDALESRGFEIQSDVDNLEIESETVEAAVEDTDIFNRMDFDEDVQDLNSFYLYLNAIGKHPLLSQEEEYKLATQAKYGNEAESKAAKEMLIISNLRLVVSIAKRYTYKAEFLDLIQTGNIGLMKAVDKYDPDNENGAKLATLATWWIKQAITRMIADTANTIRVPVYIQEVAREVTKYADDYRKKHGEEPSTAAISREFGIGEETLLSFYQAEHTPASLDAPITEEEDNCTLAAVIPDISQDVEREAMKRSCHEDIMNVLTEVLDEREAKVIILYFGLDDESYGEQRALEEVGTYFGLTRERIRQIKKGALEKLENSDEVFEKLYGWLHGTEERVPDRRETHAEIQARKMKRRNARPSRSKKFAAAGIGA